MNLYVAVTDYDWYRLLAAKSGTDEVNFWRPFPKSSFTSSDLANYCCSSSTRPGTSSRAADSSPG